MKQKIQKRTFYFGYIGYFSQKVQNNLVEVEIVLEHNKGKKCFTAHAGIWNCRKTDYVAVGQIFNEPILGDIEDRYALFRIIKSMWQKYHLNDLHAGTIAQEKALKNRRGKRDYESDCKYLKSKGLYEDEYKGKSYRYGSGWIYYSIPKKDLEKIEYILNTESQEQLEQWAKEAIKE